MIDEKKLLAELEKWINDTAYLKEKYSGSVQFKDGTGENIMYAYAEIAHDVLSTVIEKINEQEKVREWIPCSKKMPEPEKEVEITYTYNDYRTGKPEYGTARAFYEDGTLTTGDSAFCWEDIDNWEYSDEKDAYIIPEGWWEGVSFAEQSGIVDDKVIAWRELPEPYQEDNKSD